MPKSLISSALASRFFARWQHAHNDDNTLIDHCSILSQDAKIFTILLEKEIAKGFSLPKAMRRLRNRLIVSLIQYDLNESISMHNIVTIMSIFADFAIQTTLYALTQEMIAAHGTPIGQESQQKQELIVLGMGKLGGHELNVSSDIDLIFIYPEKGETQPDNEQQRPLSNHEFFIRLGKKLIHDLSEIDEHGFVFRVDMALRPNGNSGPLSASITMLEEYFIVQGREWERYAWIKARPITGNADDITYLESIVRPFVYRRYLDFGAIDAMRNMHAQIRAEVVRQETRHPERGINVKLGRGGIREIEFIAQVFQLIRGGRDPSLREKSTRSILNILPEKNLLATDTVTQLLFAYEFLRNVEHRLQYIEDAQTHTLPAQENDQLLVANMMGYQDVPTFLSALEQQRQFVANQFDLTFNDKEEPATAQKDSQSTTIALQMFARLPDAEKKEAISQYLHDLGFIDAINMSNKLITTGKSSRLQALPLDSRKKFLSLINNALSIIQKLKDNHDKTLGRLLDLLENIARRSAYLSLLIEYPHALQRVIKMIHSSEWAAKFLTKHPILLDELLSNNNLRNPPNWDEFSHELEQELAQATYQGAIDTELQMNILRDQHHAKLFRLLAQDLEGALSMEQLADHLSHLADIMINATLRAVWQSIPNTHQAIPQFAIIAYGKLGGKELGYASDLDIIFVYEDDHPDAPSLYAKLAQRLITWMTTHTSSGILFDIDIALRPDGGSGLMVSSLAAFHRYQTKSAWVWEHQALTRARFCAGDQNIGDKFLAIREEILCQTRDIEVLKKEILSMRKKMRTAHPNRSNLFDIKHDKGGMIDIEFIVQFLVLQHSHTYHQLTANIGNIALLKLCATLQLINTNLAQDVANIYRQLRVIQHKMRLQGDVEARIPIEEVSSIVKSAVTLWEEVFDCVL